MIRRTWGYLSDATHPALLAFALAILVWPVVALTLAAVEPTRADAGANSRFVTAPLLFLSATDPARWAAAGGAVLASALVTGRLCAPLARRHAKLGGWLTLTLAWVVAVATVPVGPALLGRTIGLDPNRWMVFGGDFALVMDTSSPLAALSSWPGPLLFFWLGPLLEPVAFLTLVVGVTTWTLLVRRGDRSSAVAGQ
jgi:hypothetical protein